MKIRATYSHKDNRGNHLLLNVRGQYKRDHAWINGGYNVVPDTEPGRTVQFFASPHWCRGEMRLTDIREWVVL